METLAGCLTPCREYIAGITPECLPCGGCELQERRQAVGEFARNVDEAVPLAALSGMTACSVEMGGQEDHASREGIWFGGSSADASAGTADILPLSVPIGDGDEVCRVDSAPTCQCLPPCSGPFLEDFEYFGCAGITVVRLEDSAEVHLCTVDLPRDPTKDSFHAGVLQSMKSWGSRVSTKG